MFGGRYSNNRFYPGWYLHVNLNTEPYSALTTIVFPVSRLPGYFCPLWSGQDGGMVRRSLNFNLLISPHRRNTIPSTMKAHKTLVLSFTPGFSSNQLRRAETAAHVRPACQTPAGSLPGSSCCCKILGAAQLSCMTGDFTNCHTGRDKLFLGNPSLNGKSTCLLSLDQSQAVIACGSYLEGLP